MEQRSGFGLHETNYSNDILALLHNLISQSDLHPDSSSSNLLTNLPNLVVTANTNEGSIVPIVQTGVEVEENQYFDTECTSPESNLQSVPNLIHPTSSTTTIAAGTQKNAPTDSSENISHSNICKTINEITTNQHSLIASVAMPQNTLLEEAISMSNILPPTASNNNHMPMQNDIRLQQPQNMYQEPNWNPGNLNSGNNAHNDSSSYSQQNFIPQNLGVAPSFSNTNVETGYLSGPLSASGFSCQQRFVEHSDGSGVTNQLNHILESTAQIPVQDYQSHLSPNSLAVAPISQELSAISSFSKVGSFNGNPMYNAGLVQMAPSQNVNLPQAFSSYSTTYHEDGFPVASHIQATSKTKSDSSGEDIEDRSGEKKLITTPIPSDAEKMSSSGSVSSGSLEESPSPRGLDQEHRLNNSQIMSVNQQSFSNNVPSGNYTSFAVSNQSGSNQEYQKLINAVPMNNQFNNTDMLSDGDGLSVPVPESVVEIAESSPDYHTVMDATTGDNVLISPTLPTGDQQLFPAITKNGSSMSSGPAVVNSSNSDKSHQSKRHLEKDGSCSWSVLKEERRKRKLEKKQAKYLAAQSLSNQIKNCDSSSSSSVKKNRHKHKHRSKHHRKEDGPTSNIKGIEQLMPKNRKEPTEQTSYVPMSTHSSVIPKVTADPTSNLHPATPKAPPRQIKSITEKVRQQMQEDKARDSGKQKVFSSLHPVISQIPKSSIQSEIQSPSSRQWSSSDTSASAGTATIVPSKLAPVCKANEASSKSAHQWQTVTAVQGPKLPPVLSERDRIPKRGRPSKKMSEINLKYKGGSSKTVNTQHQTPSTAAPAAVSPEKTSVVAMYTINESGFKELDNKPKQNHRSKEKAVAFRNLLSEISRTTSIQNKTAGAKDVVGAFKAIGVRTRKQTSKPSANDTDGKKKRSRNRVLGGDSLPPAKPAAKDDASVKCLDDQKMYTFSELAKQFKISNSILYRAMEQSQKSNMSKRKPHKQKESRSSNKLLSKTSVVAAIPSSGKSSSSENAPEIAAKSEVPKSLNNVDLDEIPSKESQEAESLVADTLPLVKPTSLSSEQSADLSPTDKTKRKKKKKHKKEKHDSSKKKKRQKDKKKKSKRKEKLSKELADSVFIAESSNELFSETVSNARISSPEPSEKAKLPVPADAQVKPTALSEQTGVPQKTIKSSSSKEGGPSTRSNLQRSESVSSVSACEETYDGGNSSSEVEESSPHELVKSAINKSTICHTSSSAPPSAVFGSGIISIMPSFQGIKEHGGLLPYSDNAKSVSEVNEGKVKKHKHKKKKLTGRPKTNSDPEFLCKVEGLMKSFEHMRLSSTIGFLSSSFSGKSSNVFATGLQVKAPSFRSSFEPDALLYRDPSKSNNKQRNHNKFSTSKSTSAVQSFFSSTPSSVTSSRHSNMSTFCQSKFFRNHGMIKPYSDSPQTSILTPLVQTPATKSRESFIFIKDMPTQPLFSQSSNFSSLLQSNSESVTLPSEAENRSMVGVITKPEEENAKLKPVKRKRGWPRGKPRGPRSKKALLDADSEQDIEDEEESNHLDQVTLTQATPTTKEDVTFDKSVSRNSFNAPPGISKLSQPKESTKEDKRLQTSVPQKPVHDSGGSSQVLLNNDLVDHIKAAITQKLTSSNVCSDTVAKTVDSAFASFLQGQTTEDPNPVLGETVSFSSKTTSGDLVSSNSSKKTKRRGRPPKLSKPSGNDPVSAEDNKASDKHPKKLWASMHQGSSKVVKSPEDKPKKRGPGRPRKNQVESAPSSKAEIQQARKASIATDLPDNVEPATCQRASASYIPSTSLVKKHLPSSYTSTPQKKRGRKPGALKSVSMNSAAAKVVKKSRRKSFGVKGKAKVTSTELAHSKALKRREVSSPGDTHTVKKSSLPSSTEAHENVKMDNAACLPVPSSTAESEQTKSRSNSESSPKACSKKSLESVVAKLKSKQSDSCSDTSRNDNPTKSDTYPNIQISDHGANDKTAFPKFDISLQGNEINYATSQPNVLPTRKRCASNDSDYKPVKKAAVLSRNGERATVFTEKQNFLHAGLFSAAFKTESNGKEEEENIIGTVNSALLPPPKHAGIYYRKTSRDFQLSHDIWREFQQNQIQPKQSVSTNFLLTDKNIHVDTHSSPEQNDHICQCPKFDSVDGVRCGQECLNRLKHTECSSSTCPSGERCSNRKIQTKQWWKDVKRCKTDEKGWGVQTTTDLPEGQFILEYVGEVVTEVEFRRRFSENYVYHSHRYCAQLETGKVIDAYRVGNVGRFLNHSCEPNCEMQRWESDGEYRLCLFSKQPIKAGEELTFDYSLHSVNMDQLQMCRCGAPTCRGEIGGKARLYLEGSFDLVAKTCHGTNAKKKLLAEEKTSNQLQYTTVYENSMQPIGDEEKAFIKDRRPFLYRNLIRIKRQHEKANLLNMNQSSSDDKKENNDKVEKSLLLYEAMQDVFFQVMSCKDESGVSVAIPFLDLRPKQRNIKDPVDLSFVQDKIEAKQYDSLEEFSLDLLHAFRNAEKCYGRKTSFGKDVARLRRVFTTARNNAAAMLGQTTEKIKNKAPNIEQETEDRHKNSDFIRCICGIYNDEGAMIQCEKCYVWQHCDCMKVEAGDYNDSTEYLCEECDERIVDREVEVVPQPHNAPPGHTYYLTLEKDKLLIKQGDCVRLIHDHCLRQRNSNNPPVRTSYRLQSHSTPDSMDFFRIKKLWTDDNGNKFAYGHHFARPQDTKHSEGRLFFTNELIATPFHEIVPLEAVVSQCCVMDLETYRNGKPKAFKEADIYICQHGTDLSLRIVNKVIKNRYPICTKAHVFQSYPVKIVTVRDHQVPEQYRKTQSRRTQWLRSIDRGGGSDYDESSGDEEDADAAQTSFDEVTSETVAMETGDVLTGGNERNEKERRLLGILSKLREDANKKKEK